MQLFNLITDSSLEPGFDDAFVDQVRLFRVFKPKFLHKIEVLGYSESRIFLVFR